MKKWKIGKVEISYDGEVDALYIQLKPGKSTEQQRLEIEGYLDYDKDDNLIGIEILNVIEQGQICPLREIIAEWEKGLGKWSQK